MSDDDTRRFFASFANAALERSLPQIREWLKRRLGPRASLGGLSLEGERVRLRDARLPFAGHLVLHVDTALLWADPAALVAAGVDLAGALRSVRLESMRGTLHAYRDGEPALSAPVRVTARPSGEWLDADVVIDGGSWRVVRGEGEQAPLAGRARVRVDGPAWSLTELTLTSGDARVEGSVRGAARTLEAADVEVRSAGLGHLADAFEALTARTPPPIPLPWGAQVDGRFEREGARTRARLDGGEGTRRIALRVSLEGERIEVAELEACLGWADVTRALPLVSPDSADVLVEGRLEGTTRAPRGTVTATCAALASPHLARETALLARVDLEGSWAPQLRLQLPGVLSATLRPTLEDDRLGGGGEVELIPASLRVRGAEIEGPPIGAPITFDGTRAAPRAEARFATPTLTATPSRGKLHARRLEGRVGYDGGLVFSIQARVGPGAIRLTEERASLARIDRSDLEAMLALVAPRLLERARLPEGTQLWAELRRRGDRLEGEAHAEAARSRLSLAPLRLSRAEGWEGTRIQSLFDFEDAREAGLWRAPITPRGKVELEARVAGEALRITARSRSLELTEPTPLALERARVEAVVTAGRVEIETLEGALLDGALEAKGRWTRDEGLLIERARLTGARPWGEVRVDASVRGTLERLHGTAEAKTEESALTLTLGLRDGRFDETQVEGWIEPADLPAPRGLSLTPGERWMIRGAVSGPVRDPRVTLEAHAPRQTVALGRRVVSLEDVYVAASGTRATLDVSELRAQLLGGRLRGSGHVGLGAFRGLLGELTLEGIDLGPLEAPVSGEASARLVVHRLDPGPLHALLRLRVASPRYPALSRLTPTLDRLGLPALPTDGDEPMLASVRLEDGGLEVFALSAGVEGARLTGALTKAPLWSGALYVHASEAWLSGHRLLRMKGGLTVPLRVEGDGPMPRIRPDVLAAIDAWIGKSRVGASVQRLLDQLAAKAPPPGARPPHDAGALAGTDTLLDRVARGDRADRAVEALLDRGLTPKELADALASGSRRS